MLAACDPNKVSFIEYIKSKYRIVVVDSEFQFDRSMNYPKRVLCFVYKDLSTGKIFQSWEDNKNFHPKCPFDFDTTLFVMHTATADVGSFIKSYYGKPPNIFDIWTEYSKLYKNIRQTSLLAMCNAYGIKDAMTAAEKEENRNLIIEQDSWTPNEQELILDYCTKDVELTSECFLKIVDELEKKCNKTSHEDLLWEAMHRGQSMACVAKTQINGMPIDNVLVNDFNEHWESVKKLVIQRFNKKLKLWDENNKFSNVKFEQLLKKLDLYNEWPRTPTLKLKTNADTLSLYSDTYPEIKLFGRVNNLLNSAKLAEYIVSEDGRLRPFGGFHMFGTHTGRCTPSSKWIFGTAKWGRNILKPSWGSAIVYLDYKSEEPFIQAHLSGDKNLLKAYNSGDIYMHTAKLAKVCPEDATKETHSEIRKIFKIIVLASNYGMGLPAITKKLKKFSYTKSEAAGLYRKYKEVYSEYFKWIARVQNAAAADGYISTTLGWDRRFKEGGLVNPRSLLNWPIQAMGGEVLRNALIRLTEARIKVCAMVHDAFLIECPLPELNEEIRKAKSCMVDAARFVVGDASKFGKEAATIFVDDEVHKGNFKQEKEDQEIFDTIFEEINKYKKSKFNLSSQNLSNLHQNSVRAIVY